VLAHRSRTAVESTLRHEPIARGSLVTLGAAALAALVLAVAGLLLALVNDVRDERGELLDLEIQGATPAALRRHLRLRAALTTAAGLVGGVALGAVLSILVVDFVALTANAAVPEPPLRLYIDWRALGIGAVVYLVVTTLVILAVTWLPFRDVRRRVAPEAA
jgi:ABC-type lipoprotein release transport system permease subunit